MSDAIGSWVGLYHWVVEKLMRERLTAERDVLTVLAMRANPLGFCWPGVGYIAQLCGRADSTVENALRRLEAMEYIAIVRTENLVRNRVDIDYQVRPDVMVIAPDQRDLAFKLWQQNCNVNITIVMKESQPTTKNQNQEQTTVSSPRTNNNNKQLSVNGNSRAESSVLATTKPENAENQNAENSGSAAKSTAAAPQSPNPTPVPQSPSPLVTYPDALQDEADEAVAARMNADTRYMMSVATARGLVVKYGASTCQAALTHMSRCTGINTPAAFLRATIEKRGVDPVADAKIPVDEADAKPWLDYVSGKYADYVQSETAQTEEQKRDE